jgi:hypothetical protein
LLRTIKTEFRTRNRFPVRVRTRPTCIPKSGSVVAELVGKASLSVEAAEALGGWCVAGDVRGRQAAVEKVAQCVNYGRKKY